MEIQNILSNLYLDPRVDRLVNQHNNPDDLKQDVFIVLMDKDPELITGLHKRNELFFYTTTIVKNIVRINQRVKKFVEIKDIPQENDIDLPDYLPHLDRLPNLDNDFPYFKEILKAVVSHGGQRAAARATGIPRPSIGRDIKFIREFLKKAVC